MEQKRKTAAKIKRERSKEKSETRRAQSAGKRERKALVDELADILTCEIVSSDQLRELQAMRLYFKEARDGFDLAEKICRVHDDKPELRRALLLSCVLSCLEKLV
jgi:hypothetical protein